MGLQGLLPPGAASVDPQHTTSRPAPDLLVMDSLISATRPQVRRSHSHSLTRDKCTVQIHDDCLRLTAAKLGGKRELVELSAMNLLGATLQPDAFGSQSVAISVLTTPSSASSEGGVSSLELYELSDFEEPAEAAACRDAAQALGASICPLADRGGVLAIVNPTSGHKKGEEIFRRVEPLFVRAGVKLTAKFTRPGTLPPASSPPCTTTTTLLTPSAARRLTTRASRRYGGHAADIVRGYVTNLAGTCALSRRAAAPTGAPPTSRHPPSWRSRSPLSAPSQ